ncbi:MAG: DNA/RNA non-specific endonuclease [Tepidiformaceae bacterium]
MAALDEAIEVVATSISTRVPADHRPPTPVAPEDRPHTSSPPKPLPDEPPTPPDEDNDCRTTFAGPNEIDPRPTTTFRGEEVASGVVAILSATERTSPAVRGQKASYPAVGWGPNRTHRGHLIAKQFGGQDGVRNVVAMWQSTNRGAYWGAERKVKDAIERDCSEVLVDVTVTYHDGSESVEELLARDRLPADYFIFEATTDTGALYVAEPGPILNRQKDLP